MTAIVWAQEYQRTVQAFRGQQPRSPEDEQDALDHWQRSPAAFRTAVDEASEQLQQGTIRWGWSVLLSRLRDQAGRDRSQTADIADERQRAIHRAEQWLKSVGLLLEQEQVERELYAPEETTPPLEWLEQLERTTRGSPGRPAYDKLLRASIDQTRAEGPQPIEGSGGILQRWADDEALRQRLLELWAELRPKGQRSEAASLAYQERLRERSERFEKLQADRRQTPAQEPDGWEQEPAQPVGGRA